MTDPVRYAHHHARTMRLVNAANAAYSEAHRLMSETGYYAGGWKNPDPRIVALDRRTFRLQRLIDRAQSMRERYASRERWTPYRAWPY